MEADAVLTALVREAEADPDTLGLALSGSRGIGAGDASSDYDLVWVLTDDAYEACEQKHVKRDPVDIVYSSPTKLADAATKPGWWSYGLAASRVLLDKSGEIGDLLERIGHAPDAPVYEDYDTYLNAFVRSARAWEKGDELGARLHASESLVYLVRALFGLERRWAPYHDRLRPELGALEGQGWKPGYLERSLLEIARTGDPVAQVELLDRVEALMEQRGILAHQHWDGQLDRAKASARG